VKKLETHYGITPDGIVDVQLWARMYQDYRQNYKKIPEDCFNVSPLYPGYLIYRDMGDNNVRLIQTYLLRIAQSDPDIPKLTVTGVYDDQMEAAVKAFNKKYAGFATGIIGPEVWNNIVRVYANLVKNEQQTGGQ
jgi:peptidoglycan hydrolase-like protein with peptidoglycan-binding domain